MVYSNSDMYMGKLGATTGGLLKKFDFQKFGKKINFTIFENICNNIFPHSWRK